MAKTKTEIQRKYDDAHTVRIAMKLNKSTDADILKQLDAQESKQGYIKSLIRADMNK